jgi:hypothetical protein
MVICLAVYLIEHQAGITAPVLKSLVLFGLNVIIVGLVFGLLDRNVFVKGSGRQRHSLNARARRATVAS